MVISFDIDLSSWALGDKKLNIVHQLTTTEKFM